MNEMEKEILQRNPYYLVGSIITKKASAFNVEASKRDHEINSVIIILVMLFSQILDKMKNKNILRALENL